MSQGYILVVDDDKSCHHFLKLVIDAHTDMKVLTACNGKECIRVLQNNISQIKLVILDYLLPDTNASELLTKNLNNFTVPVIVQSGLAINLLQDKTRGIKNVKIIMKPYKTQEILNLIEESIATNHFIVHE